MQEIWIQRDETGRIVEVVGQGLRVETPAAEAALRFLRAVETTMRDYLHVDAELSTEAGVRLVVDRQDFHLHREIDAVTEGLVIGLRQLAAEYPADLEVNEPTVRVEV